MKYPLSKSKLFFCHLALGTLLYGCIGMKAQPPAIPPVKNPARYLHAIVQKKNTITDVSGYAKVRVSAGGKTASTRNIFFVKKPDLLRVETLGFLSRPALYFTADSASMTLYTFSDNICYRGTASAENFERIIGIPLDLRHIVQAFFGVPPLRSGSAVTPTCTQESGRYLFTIVDGGRKELLWVDPSGKNITGYKLFDHGQPVIEYLFSHFDDRGGDFFPLKIEIHHYTYRKDISIELESLNFDPIPVQRFRLALPQEIPCRSIEDAGAEP